MNLKTSSLVLLLTLFSSSFASAQQAEPEVCIESQDLEDISRSFRQFRRFLGNQSEYCEADMGADWLELAHSLVVLKNTTPDEPDVDPDDALTFKAITENNWWSYFTNRADRFSLENRCQEGVVAFVRPFFGNGLIHICPFFFDLPLHSQASVMMHEVRHFDGHAHVTCTRGNEAGSRGACDNNIRSRGSYAISVQTIVGLARSADTPDRDKPSLEAEALYMAFNKFNQVPEVKVDKAILLSNQLGEVYRWTLGAGADLIHRFSEPTRIRKSGQTLTLYPLDSENDAFRMDVGLSETMENPGLYAVQYNSESPAEREKYDGVSYYGSGGLLKDNQLTVLCNRDDLELGTTDLRDLGDFKSMITLSKDEADIRRESYLLSRTGDLVRYECADTSSDELVFEESEIRFIGSEDIESSFGLFGEQYALTTSGELKLLVVQGNNMEARTLSMPVSNGNIVSATPMSRPQVF